MSQKNSKVKSVLLPALFGLIFGFLLQKGGVAKYNVLIGILLLKDFTVAKVMLSAILVGMIGVYSLYGLGIIQKLFLSPLSFKNVLGGLVFGVGFGLLAYCPGTGAAALGQGNWDALFGIAGLMMGSFLYAMVSERIEFKFKQWGEYPARTIPEVLGISERIVVPIIGFMILFLLYLLSIL